MNFNSSFLQEAQNMLQYKLIILGLSGTGKTALLRRYQQNFYDDAGITTVAVDYSLVKRPKAWYHYYDTCGQEVYRALVSNYYRGSDACILAYDVSNPSTVNQISYYYDLAKQYTPDSLLYIVGCKSDLKQRVFENDIKKTYKGVKHFLTSAKLGKGVHQAFMHIQSDLISRKPQISSNKKREIQIGKPKKPQNKCCT